MDTFPALLDTTTKAAIKDSNEIDIHPNVSHSVQSNTLLKRLLRKVIKGFYMDTFSSIVRYKDPHC